MLGAALADPKTLDLTKAIAPAASAIIAIIALAMSALALLTSARVARAQIYLELRRRFGDINSQMPKGNPPDTNDYHDPTWRPTVESPELPRLEKYWYHTFDEWYVTRVLHPWPLGRLWTKFYQRAVFEGLKHQAIREVLRIMIEKKRTSFSGRGTEFVMEQIEVYQKYNSEKRKSQKRKTIDWSAFGVDRQPTQNETNTSTSTGGK